MVDQFSVVCPVSLVVVIIILVLHLLLLPIQVLDVSRVLQVGTGHGSLSIIMSVVVATRVDPTSVASRPTAVLVSLTPMVTHHVVGLMMVVSILIPSHGSVTPLAID